MKFGLVPLDEAEGKILAHHIAAPTQLQHGNRGRTLRKGKTLRAEDIAVLRDLGREMVFAAELEPGDVDEDTAASRVAQAVCGDHQNLSRPNVGRVNLQAQCRAILGVDAVRLAMLNGIEGITLATLLSQSVVHAGQTVATVKVIPFAVAEGSVRLAESIGSQNGPILRLQPLKRREVALILYGSPWARQRVLDAFEGSLRKRIEALDSHVNSVDYVPIEDDESGEQALMQALSQSRVAGVDLIVLAGESAIMDRQDMAPRAIERLGGQVASFGAPVDPGNLLMVAYLRPDGSTRNGNGEGEIPVLGAPGCARNLKPNVIDWVLPRLLSGERLARADIAALGHGGLLQGHSFIPSLYHSLAAQEARPGE
jgi:molybdenum cofactor cytidylyltransferase